MRLLLCTIACVLFLQPAWADASADEEAVWALEEAYWVYVRNNDLDGYRTLWDERFVGWPSFSDKPLGKKNITDWIPPLHADRSRVYDYKLKREAVRSFGEVVVAHYLYRDVYRSADTGEVVEENEFRRITHTWQRRGDSWQIVTGMSASWIGAEAGN